VRVLFYSIRSERRTKMLFGRFQHFATEMDRACSTYAGEERCIQDFGGEI
jgi:hypothetical protein